MLKLKKLTDRELIGQLFFISLNADEYTTSHSREKLFRKYFKIYPPGGVFIRRGTVEQVFSLAKWLQEHSRVPLWISADIERGVGGTFPGGSAFPHQASLGSMDDPATTYEVGKVVARECKAVGINLIFAPVVDLLTENPVINIRAFHEDPEKVILHASAFLAGLEESGVHGVLKHFPGHGQLKKDTHVDGETIHLSLTDSNPHIRPFVTLAASMKKVSIMPAHVQIDDELLCFKPELDKYLKPDYKTEILWISDDMQMNGFKQYVLQNQIDLAAKIITSPVHHWLNPEAYRLLASQIEEKLTDSNLKEILRNKVQRILTFKKRWISANPAEIRFSRMAKYMKRREHLRLSDIVAQNSIVCLKQGNFSHFYHGDKIQHIISTDKNDRLSTLTTFRELLARYCAGYREKFAEEWNGKGVQRKIFSVYQRVYGGVKIDAERVEFVKKVTNYFTNTDILIFWGNIFPYREAIAQFPGSVFWVPSYMPVSQKAMFEILLGKHAVRGVLPASLGKDFPSGFGSEISPKKLFSLLKGSTDGKLQQFLEKLVRNNVVTGLVLGHVSGGRCRIWTAGKPKNNRLQPISPNESTKFDVASLTKVLVTTPLILHLIGQGRLDFQMTLNYFYTNLDDAKKRITLKQLLTHSSGLKSWIPLYEFTDNKFDAVRMILEEQLEYSPGTQIKYSDLGFILLGDIIEKMTDKSLNEAYRDVFTSPLEITDDLFYPSARKIRRNDWICSHPEWKTSDPPISFIDDKNARLFPDGAGHAGLLANVKGILQFIQMIFEEGRWFDKVFITPEILASSFGERIKIGNIQRAIGWDVPTKPSQAGRLYENSTSFGHLAFTGCSLWFDVKRKRATVLLTNRTFTGYPVERFRKIRRRIHNLLSEEDV